MKVSFYIFCLFPLLAYSQIESKLLEKGKLSWYDGQVILNDGRKFQGDLRFIMSWNEGAVQIKSGDKEETLSPQRVRSFVYFDSTLMDYREFRSVPCVFLKKPGSALAFVEVIQEGSKYFLYRRYLPDFQNNYGLIAFTPFISLWVSGKVRPALFLQVEDGKAHQISRRTKNAVYNPSVDEVKYRVKRKRVKAIIGKDWMEMKRYASKNRLVIRREDGFSAALKHIEGSEFTYNRKDTPKKLRN